MTERWVFFIGSSVAYVCYFSWAIGHHVSRVVDAIEDAIPTVSECGNLNGIRVLFESEADTTEVLYNVVFGVAIAVGAFSLALVSHKYKESYSATTWSSLY